MAYNDYYKVQRFFSQIVFTFEELWAGLLYFALQ